jgi:hypothetical protein
MWEPTSSKFGHKIREGKGAESISVDRYPIVYEIIFEASKNARDLDVVSDSSFGIDKIVQAVVLKVFSRFGCNFSIGELGCSCNNEVRADCNFLIRHWRGYRIIKAGKII